MPRPLISTDLPRVSGKAFEPGAVLQVRLRLLNFIQAGVEVIRQKQRFGATMASRKVKAPLWRAYGGHVNRLYQPCRPRIGAQARQVRWRERGERAHVSVIMTRDSLQRRLELRLRHVASYENLQEIIHRRADGRNVLRRFHVVFELLISFRAAPQGRIYLQPKDRLHDRGSHLGG